MGRAVHTKQMPYLLSELFNLDKALAYAKIYFTKMYFSKKRNLARG
jgi:hypothetical protein